MAGRFQPCSVEDCKGNAHHDGGGATGLCKNHYNRARAHGDPSAGGTPHGEPFRYLADVVLTYDGADCLAWPYATDVNGYGQIRKDGKARYVARLVCEELHGPAPTDKHQAAHSCGNGHKGCCNPQHLRWATVRENHADKRRHGTYIDPPVIRKLSEAQMEDIRGLSAVMSNRAIGRVYGVTHQVIAKVLRA